MASYPWIVPWKRQQQNQDDFPNLRRWLDIVRERRGTQRAYAGGVLYSSRPAVTEEENEAVGPGKEHVKRIVR
jgi:GSH-dependent disulfide-bond oxidoreductase